MDTQDLRRASKKKFYKQTQHVVGPARDREVGCVLDKQLINEPTVLPDVNKRKCPPANVRQI